MRVARRHGETLAEIIGKILWKSRGGPPTAARRAKARATASGAARAVLSAPAEAGAAGQFTRVQSCPRQMIRTQPSTVSTSSFSSILAL